MPPALVATLPPMEEIRYEPGSGGYQSPCSAAASFTSTLSAPGSATAVRVTGSTVTAVIRSVLSTRQPSTAVAPPASPVPAPRGTTGTRCSLAQRSAVCTCAAQPARTTARGSPGTSVVWSRRYFSIRAGSVTTTSSGSASRNCSTNGSCIGTSSPGSGSPGSGGTILPCREGRRSRVSGVRSSFPPAGPERSLATMRWAVAREYVRGSLWVIPTGCVAGALVLGLLLSQVDVGPTSPLAFQGTADDARGLLSGIAGTMITVIAVVLGLAVVALQLSSTQFSPRLLRNFLRDRSNQVVLGVLVGTFAYSAGGLFTVGVAAGGRSDKFPRFAVSVAIGLLFLSLALLVFFADHLAHSLQVDWIMRVVEQNALPVIRADEFTTEEDAPPPPAWAVAAPARRSGYVQAVECRPLLRAATQRRWTVLLHVHVGEHVVAGTVLAWAWSTSPEDPPPTTAAVAATLERGVRIGFERTLEQDLGLGFRQLADPACKALSPAVNDPYTAVQAVDHLTVLFGALAARPVGDYVGRDAGGTVRLIVPGRRFAEILSITVGLIRRYGAAEPNVVQALLRLLATCAALATEDPRRWADIEGQADLLVADAERAVAQPEDLVTVHAQAEDLAQVLSARRGGPAQRADRPGTQPSTTMQAAT